MYYLKKIYFLLDKNNKYYFLSMVAFSIFFSLIEVVGVSVIMPFIDVATNFSNIQTNKYYNWFFTLFDFSTEVNFVIFFGIVLLIFYIFRAIINLLYVYYVSKFSQMLYSQISKKLFDCYLKMPYKVFVNKNSSYLTKTISIEARLLSDIIRNVLMVISELFIVVVLYALMTIVNWKVTLVFTIIFSLKILFLTKVVSRKIASAGGMRAKYQEIFYEVVNKMFGNFKQIKLQNDDKKKILYDQFNVAIDKYSYANIKNDTLSSAPKIILETGGFGLIVLLLVFLVYKNQSDVLYILPVLSLFVLSLYRILPAINRIVSGYNLVVYNHSAIYIVDKDLSESVENISNNDVNFKHSIELKNIYFAYRKENTLSDINLQINKGEKIAFVGKSGSGKSTLVDLIIGLYRPVSGSICIDGKLLDNDNLKNWRSKIGYIPQQVYLFDGTVAENVFFGNKKDFNLLEKVLRQANIFEFIQNKDGVNTLVGEGGVQLSGGQKQRIAIARALYGQPEILVLDEATSALDDDTEEKIMSEIYKISQDKTLIIIAHRIGTIQKCDKIYQLKNNTISAK
jgi:ABC-type multidrug transport system fused ATPase/permease subunit